MEFLQKYMFSYDLLGRLAVSQNSQQILDKKYSYTLYDALGRINEVGQKPQAVNSMSQTVSQNPVALNSWIITNGGVREQVTQTVYDQPYAPFIIPDPLMVQKNLRNRVSYTSFKNLATDALHYTGTFYTYDIHGNVDTLLQDYNFDIMKSTGNRFKKITYDYDLISGKVNAVHYQPGQADAFYHKYYYDAENRLTDVYTSKDSLNFERDSRYDYYKHGPLARQIIGQNQVQGFDYAYTLQGWLKGMNSTEVGSGLFDMGGDGINGSTVAKDVFGFSLQYFSNDYKAINVTVKPFAAIPNAVGLYNGNIAAMSVNLPKVGEPLTYGFTYDQLNRLVKMSAFKGLNAVNNTWTPIATNDYAEDISYDANGNILTYKRNGSTAKLDMDKMTYQYPKDANGNAINNRLRYVQDEVAAANYADDIDSQTALTLAQVQAEKLPEQPTDNYGYDAIGNLIKDTKEGISSIKWNVYGKIQSITKNGKMITYSYDAAGNRITKTVGDTVEIYVRDAAGNVMLTYQKNAKVNSGHVSTKEFYKYGSALLGVKKKAIDMQVIAPKDGKGTVVRGEDEYYVQDHRGNVYASVSDKKLQVDANADGIVDGYLPDIKSAQDYSSSGVLLANRKFGIMGRHGFNGKELENEVVQYDYGFRIYDPRLVRFKSVDPLFKGYPWNSPYSYAEGDMIRSIDLDGLEKYVVTNYYNKFGQKEETMIGVVSDKQTGEKQNMELRYDQGKKANESVAEGYDVLVRNLKENAKGQINTSYERRNNLLPTENKILNSKKEVAVQDVNPFQVGLGGAQLDGGQAITGSENAKFDDKKFEMLTFRMKYKVNIPTPPTTNQINTAVNNLAAQVDVNTNKPSQASISAAKSLGNLLKGANAKSGQLSVTFLDPSGYSSFYTRPAINGSTFGKNADAQIQALSKIINTTSGVSINFSGIKVTPNAGSNGAALQLNK
jgi:RHS repeat-associated protein